MKGCYKIKVWNNRLEYNLEIKRNVTIIKGNGATGKSKLIIMLDQWLVNGRKSGVKCETNVKIAVFDMKTKWKRELEKLNNTVIFVDESAEYLYSPDFAAAFEKSNNYIVIITRGSMHHFHYSIDEIYNLETETIKGNSITTLSKRYENVVCDFKPKFIITEDSGLGHEVLKECLGCDAVSSHGNGSVVKVLKKYRDVQDEIFALVDGANYGSFIEKTFRIIDGYNIQIYASESFEYLVLNTGGIRRYCNNRL